MSLRAAILGFLDIEPSSGYSLRQRFEGSVGSFWSVTQSQIYRELHTLEKDRLVTTRVARGRGKPDRRTYSLTEAGTKTLREWLHEPLEPLQLRHPLLLKLVFAAQLEPAVLDALLAQYQIDMKTIRTGYTTRLESTDIFDLARSEREATIWRLSIQHGITWCDGEIAWLRKARLELTKTKPRTRRSKSTMSMKE